MNDKGWQTSEFYVTIGGQLLAVLALVGIVPTGDVDRLTAILIKGVTSAFGLAAAGVMGWRYIQARTDKKVAEIEASASVTEAVETAKIAAGLPSTPLAQLPQNLSSAPPPPAAHRSLLPVALLVLLLAAGGVQAQHHLAVVKLISHGGSGTVVYTAPGKTWILSCGHCFEPMRGQDMRQKPIRLEVPWSPAPKPSKVTLLAVDYNADLSLIRVDDGPWPHCVDVPSTPYQPGALTSAGYDRMKGLTAVPVHRCTLYTRERPVEGRSGGGLIDAKGQLCGVVQGYELTHCGRGMYVDAPTIRAFLTKHGWGAEPDGIGKQPPVPQQQSQPQVEQPYAGQPRGTPHNANRTPRRGFGGQWRAPQQPRGQQYQQAPSPLPAGC